MQDSNDSGDNDYYEAGQANDNNYGQSDTETTVPVDIYAYARLTTTMEFRARNHDLDGANAQRAQMGGTVAAVVTVVILLMAGLGVGAVLLLKRRPSEQPDYSEVEDVREARVGSVSL